MKLTDTQIQDLYTFTRKHYVEYYDVQTELVDHLANDIEAIWEEKPELSFEKARDISFKKFGIYGFMDVVEEKQRQLSKRYLKIILRFVKEWFKLPKIILTACLVWLFYEVQSFNHAFYIYATIYFCIISFEFIKMFQSRKKITRKQKTTGKKWMLENIILAQGVGNLALILFYMVDFSLPNNHNFLELSQTNRVFCASILVLTIIIAHVTVHVIPNKAEELLEEQYPEYKLV
ncbi:hypothetical protein [Tenacibaculum jejuense]|uniref:Uncharacterized protein n=1 Tax=Tenacibaculum jejuense TaxID=584609 RepID=A0A238U6I9_9FLAO|nr:hypothetical protein [Tenacibaculum jejuense]SNR14000.1 conserved membrane protein of unknown function [Tenacibaculum jejuense]